MASAAFQQGTLLAGKYRVLDLLGEGGMGAVYLAENIDIGRQVAIKVLKAELAAEPQQLARFRQEARAAAAIGHPGIVEVLDLGVLPEGGAFIVMERLQGRTLRDHLSAQGSLAPEQAVSILGSVLDTLAAAHDAGVIHRDLKPDNIFLVERPVAGTKIVDFGISKFRGQGDVGLTRTGMVMGTPLYMSPEQARGAKDVGVSADIYSIGAILYESLSGQPPFPGETYNEVLAKVLMDAVQPLGQLRADVPEPLAALIERMLSKKPEERPQSAREAAELLRATLSGEPALSPRGTSNTLVRPVMPTPPPASGAAFRTGPKLESKVPLDATFTPSPRTGAKLEAAPVGMPATLSRPPNPGAHAPTAAPAHEEDIALAIPKSRAPLFIAGGAAVLVAVVIGVALGKRSVSKPGAVAAAEAAAPSAAPTPAPAPTQRSEPVAEKPAPVAVQPVATAPVKTDPTPRAKPIAVSESRRASDKEVVRQFRRYGFTLAR